MPRVSLLRAAAEREGYETVLALADVKTTYSAYEADDDYGYGGRRYWDEDDDEGPDGSADYEIQELIDVDVTLTHWTGPAGDRLEATSLSAGTDEVCASTETDDLEPFTSEYEGYMGNWGNTLDRWYHRAAVVVRPREQAFANRAETSPAWALDALTEMTLAGAVSGAKAAAATLEPFWDSVLRTRSPEDRGRISGIFGKALRTADAVADAATAAMLLRPFRVENLTADDAAPFGKLTSRYGQQWTTELLRAWAGAGQPAWAIDGPERRQWVAESLPGLCTGLHAATGRRAPGTRRPGTSGGSRTQSPRW